MHSFNFAERHILVAHFMPASFLQNSETVKQDLFNVVEPLFLPPADLT